MCRVSAKDSGKPMVDAAFGEVIVTCEKLWWLIKEGERYLKPEARSASYMVRGRGDVLCCSSWCWCSWWDLGAGLRCAG